MKRGVYHILFCTSHPCTDIVRIDQSLEIKFIKKKKDSHSLYNLFTFFEYGSLTQLSLVITTVETFSPGSTNSSLPNSQNTTGKILLSHAATRFTTSTLQIPAKNRQTVSTRKPVLQTNLVSNPQIWTVTNTPKTGLNCHCYIY